MKLYVISTGCYDDHRILGVMSSKRRAQMFVDRKSAKRGDAWYYTFEEMELDGLEMPPLKKSKA